MYEELVYTLRYDAGWLEQGMTQTEHDIAEHLKKAADAIEELVATVGTAYNELANNEANKPRWIPVTERLPLRGDDVLCFGDNGISIAAFVAGDKWCALPWFYVDGEQETNVTHWMPLPEPPKEATT